MLKDWKAVYNIEELVGKTVAKTLEQDDVIYIVFTDKSYVAIDTSYDSCSLDLGSVNNVFYEGCVAQKLGMLDEDELDRIKKAEELSKINAERLKRNRELRQLAELKAKYPDEV